METVRAERLKVVRVMSMAAGYMHAAQGACERAWWEDIVKAMERYGVRLNREEETISRECANGLALRDYQQSDK